VIGYCDLNQEGLDLRLLGYHNFVDGYIHRYGNEDYGALYITHVNGFFKDPCPQMIYCTPKMHYPFDRNRNYRFPVVERVEVYTKIDGTNIFQFSYKNADGKWFVSYKTRIMPFIQKHRPFYEMWLEMLKKHPQIELLPIFNQGLGLSYELYGSRNLHLVKYPVELDVALLFGVDSKGDVISPSDLILKGDVPVVDLVAKVNTKEDLEDEYSRHRREMETTIKPIEGSECFEGVEGQVWYIMDKDRKVHQFKAKPDTIEAIHMAASRKISKISVIATCWNVFEDTDVLNFDTLKPLLLEEWGEEKINSSRILIYKCIEYVNALYKIKNEAFVLLKEYEKEGLTLEDNKADVMRRMAEVFGKKNSRLVYSVLTRRI